MPRSVQLNLPPSLVKRVADADPAHVNKVDMPLEQAQKAVGRAVEKTLRRAGAAMKEFGDKGQVSRWCQGENPNVARIWQRADTRREFVRALAEESGMARVRMQIEFDEEVA